MNRVCSLALFLAALSALAAEDPKPPRTDLYGDPLPPGAVARLGTIRLRYTAAVTFCKDGKQLILCDLYGEVQFWDVATGKLVRRQRLKWKPREDESLNSAALSPDGAIAVAFSEQSVYFYDTQTGKERGRIPSLNTASPYALKKFSPDGKFLALQTSTKDREFRTQIWDVNTIEKHQTLVMSSGVKLASVAFSWDGKRLVGCAENFVDLFLWDTATGKLLVEKKNLGRFDADSLAFSPDGKTLAVGSRTEAVLRLLAADSLKEKSRLKVPTTSPKDYVTRPVFSPDGRYLAASWGTYRYIGDGFGFDVPRNVFLWELPEAKEPRRLLFYRGMPIMFAPDGKTLVCSSTDGICLYDTVSHRLLHQRPGHSCVGLAFAVSADGKILASGDRCGTLRLWDTATSKELRKWETWDLLIYNCFLSADGKRVAAGYLGGSFNFQAWEVANGKKLGRIFIPEEDGNCLYAASISADGKQFRGVYAQNANHLPGEVIFWDLSSGKQLRHKPYRLKPREDSENKVGEVGDAHAAFSADGERLTVWLGDRLGIEEVSTGSLLAKLPKGVERPLRFSPDGRLLAAMIQPAKDDDSEEGSFEVRSVLEAASGQEILRLKWKAPNKIAFTPDGRGLVVSDHKHLSVWDAETGEKLFQMAWPDSIVEAQDIGGWPYVPTLVALPGGRAAASMADGDILVWDLQASTWPNRKPKRSLEPKELQSLWADLTQDAGKAYPAMHTLTASPTQTVTFFQEHLRATDGKRIEKLLADLDSDSFETRETASQELKRMYYRAEPMLRRTLESKPSLEMRRRIEPILTEPRLPQADDLRMLRAIAVLERIGTPEARGILEKLAAGAMLPETREAQTALQRLKRRDASANGRTAP